MSRPPQGARITELPAFEQINPFGGQCFTIRVEPYAPALGAGGS
jgi:hypothetical protein